MTDRTGNETAAIRTWMRSVMEKREWSAEHWARVAGTSPTNITRFLKDGQHVPSMRTIAKLSRACGSMPTLGRGILVPVPAGVSVPMKDVVIIAVAREVRKLL